MDVRDLKLCNLPKRRTGWTQAWFAQWSIWSIVGLGLSAYVLVVLLVSYCEWIVSSPGNTWVREGPFPVTSWWDIVYFNFVSILTIGYGDFSPSGGGARFVTICEAFAGTGILGLTLAAATAKFLSPPNDAVVFSRYAYYCEQSETFMVIYINSTRLRLVNAEQSSYFKLGGDWKVKAAVRSPFVTRAVQTFYVESIPKTELIGKLRPDKDVLRFGISGGIGSSTFSAAIEYSAFDILVIPNRDELINYPGFWVVDFNDPKFVEMFHYRPADAITLVEYVALRRQGE